MRVLITGAGGFIGANLCVRLAEFEHCEAVPLPHDARDSDLAESVNNAEFVFHLAGVNRPADEAEFEAGNPGFTAKLVAALGRAKNRAPIVYASSARATDDTPYGRSKREAERLLFAHTEAGGGPAIIFRLPNVFGKWARPNYNSAVATFCHNTAQGLPIEVHNPAASLELAYIDDVIDAFLALLQSPPDGAAFGEIRQTYPTTVGAVAEIIASFPGTRRNLCAPRAGQGLVRALYSTYLSYISVDQFNYAVPIHSDARGVFVEMLKTEDSGQISYFSSKPGVVRGEHYHHTKVEKFLVLSGTAQFGFRHILTGETHSIRTRGGDGLIVETIPGWTHNITNVGDDVLLVMLWANEIFDRSRPDTVAMNVNL